MRRNKYPEACFDLKILDPRIPRSLRRDSSLQDIYAVTKLITMNTSRTHTEYIIARLLSSAFVKNVFIVMSGTAVAHIISFALTPIISRLYTPSDFGVLGSFDAVLAVVAAGVTLDYSQALMLPKEKDDAINLFMLSSLSVLLITISCTIICLIFSDISMGLIKTNSWLMLVLLVSAVMVSGLNQSAQAWCVRRKAFKQTSSSQVIRSLSSNGMKICLGVLNVGAQGLIISNILANTAASLNLVRVVLPDLWVQRKAIRIERIRRLAIEYKDFPLYSASQSIINALSAGLPVLLLTYYYDIAVAGAYAFGISILQVPMGFIMAALRQVLFQKAGETKYQGGKIAALYVKITAGLFSFAFFPTLVLFIWSQEIFIWIFGAQWDVAGVYASYLVLWLAFVFCNLPAILFARIIRIQSTVFFYDLALLVARGLTLIFGGMYFTALKTIILFSVVGAIMNMFLILLVGYAVMRKEGHVNVDTIRDALLK